MNPDDAAFTEEFKPLHVPHKYEPALNWQDKVIFALADINNGTIPEVADKLQELDRDIDAAEAHARAQEILIGLYDKGLLKAVEESDGHLRYNLSKEQAAHEGKTDV